MTWMWEKMDYISFRYYLPKIVFWILVGLFITLGCWKLSTIRPFMNPNINSVQKGK